MLTLISTIITVVIRSLSSDHIILRSPIFKSFSLIKTWNDLMQAPHYNDENKPVPFYGIRALIMVWIILVHTAMIVNFQYFRMYN